VTAYGLQILDGTAHTHAYVDAMTVVLSIADMSIRITRERPPMSEPSWKISQGELTEKDGYWLKVEAVFQHEPDSSARMTILRHYDHQPTDIDTQYLKDEILETMAETGIYSGGKD
jgi:hypothetical protein